MKNLFSQKINILIFFFISSIILSIVLFVLRTNKTIALSKQQKQIDKNINFSFNSFANVNNYDNIVNPNKKNVIILPINGVISYNPDQDKIVDLLPSKGVKYWVNVINSGAKNSDIDGLIIKVNSPGGSVVASQEVYDALVNFRNADKKIVVSILEVCASGAYYLSLPANSIIANRGSLVGSIGVIMSSLNLTELFKRYGIENDTIKSAKYKDIFSYSRPMKEVERLHLQGLVDDIHGQFVNDMIEWRYKNISSKVKRNKKTLTDSANGLIYTSKQSKSIGLIDKIGDYQYSKKIMAGLLDVKLKEIKFFKAPRNNIIDKIQTIINNSFSKVITVFLEKNFLKLKENNNQMMLK